MTGDVLMEARAKKLLEMFDISLRPLKSRCMDAGQETRFALCDLPRYRFIKIFFLERKLKKIDRREHFLFLVSRDVILYWNQIGHKDEEWIVQQLESFAEWLEQNNQHELGDIGDRRICWIREAIGLLNPTS